MYAFETTGNDASTIHQSQDGGSVRDKHRLGENPYLGVSVVELRGTGLTIDNGVNGLQVAWVGHERQVNPEQTKQTRSRGS